MDGTIVIDPPASGLWNMARDQFLAQYSSRHQIAILRIYSWEKPTLSLGRFQVGEERKASTNLSKLDWVKRGTGGGAILHDHDWTYSITWPKQNGQIKGHEQALYQAVHEGVVSWLRELGWKACLYRDSASGQRVTNPGIGEAKTFLCFDRRSDLDIVVNGYKVFGSAQKRFQGAVLQHGSILLSQSKSAPHLSGLLDLAGTDIDPRLGSRLVQEGFVQAISASLDQIGVSRWLPVSIDFKESIAKELVASIEGGLGSD